MDALACVHNALLLVLCKVLSLHYLRTSTTYTLQSSLRYPPDVIFC